MVDKRKREARQLAAAQGISYTRAHHQVAPDSQSGSADQTGRDDEHHEFQPLSWNRNRCVVRSCYQDRHAPAHRVGGLTPPEGWRTGRHRAMLATRRDGADGPRLVQVLDAASGALIASMTVEWHPAEELVAAYEAAGLLTQPVSSGIVDTYPAGSPGWQQKVTKIGLGRPDLLAHQLGYEGILHWQEWPDGSWRTPAWPLGRRHLVTAAPMSTRQAGTISVLTVREYPGGQVVLDELLDDPIDLGDDTALAQALDRCGYTVKTYGWQTLPGGVRYGTALPGHLAERDWWRLARVRITQETTVGSVDPWTDRTFGVGEILTMNQHGYGGREVLRDCWWTSTDVDGAHIIDADRAAIVEILEDHPPTWDAAALNAEEIIGLLVPHHPGADAAVQAWLAAGLHIAHSRTGLAITTPAPEHRVVGRVPRDYWDGNRFTKPYEAVIDPDQPWRDRPLGTLPHDPTAAARS